eukprot:scaffold1113_cov379-Prasinococcus_capsulatus_cf.AAC.7
MPICERLELLEGGLDIGRAGLFARGDSLREPAFRSLVAHSCDPLRGLVQARPGHISMITRAAGLWRQLLGARLQVGGAPMEAEVPEAWPGHSRGLEVRGWGDGHRCEWRPHHWGDAFVERGPCARYPGRRPQAPCENKQARRTDSERL